MQKLRQLLLLLPAVLVIAWLTLANFIGVPNEAKQQAAKDHLVNLSNAIVQFGKANKAAPSSVQELAPYLLQRYIATGRSIPDKQSNYFMLSVDKKLDGIENK